MSMKITVSYTAKWEKEYVLALLKPLLHRFRVKDRERAHYNRLYLSEKAYTHNMK